jgi:hypothetical protein
LLRTLVQAFDKETDTLAVTSTSIANAVKSWRDTLRHRNETFQDQRGPELQAGTGMLLNEHIPKNYLNIWDDRINPAPDAIGNMEHCAFLKQACNHADSTIYRFLDKEVRRRSVGKMAVQKVSLFALIIEPDR